VPAETHTHTEAVEVGAVLDLLAGIVGVDPGNAAGLTLDELDVADDLALLDLWAAVVEEYGERSLGEIEPLEPRPVTLGQLAGAFHTELSR
jgi:hypothetical protein